MGITSVYAPANAGPVIAVIGPKAPPKSAPVKPSPVSKTVDHHFTHDLPVLAKDLLQSKMVICCPVWGMKPPKGSRIVASGHEVTGPQTPGLLVFGGPDIHPMFKDLRANTERLENLRETFTIVDPDDGLRLVSDFAKEAMIEQVAAARDERMSIAAWLDNHFATDIIPVVKEKHAAHFDYMEPKLPKAPFSDSLDVILKFRVQGTLTADQFDFNNISPGARKKVQSMIEAQAEAYAKDQARAIINGAMQPIVNLAMEVTGEMPNPKFDASKPETPSNRKFLPGIDSGTRRGGFIDRLLADLDRVLHFRQFMTPEILAQTQKAREAIERAGGDVSRINEDAAIQLAIRNELSHLGKAMRQNIKESEAGRSGRKLVV